MRMRSLRPRSRRAVLAMLFVAFTAAVILLWNRVGEALFSLLLPCGNTVRLRVASPDGSREAVAWERGCGAMTDFATIITVSASGKSQWDSGEAFVASGRGDLRLSWIGPRILVIAASDVRVVRQETAVDGVDIRYAENPSAAIVPPTRKKA